MENNITLRDQVAIEAMKPYLDWWHRTDVNDKMNVLKSWVSKYGNIPVTECIARESYSIADAMLKAREL